MTREPEEDVIPLCEELGIGFVPYSPLSRAFLSGYINENTKYNASNDNRPTLPRYQADAIKANWPMVDTLAAFGNQRGLTPAQVAQHGCLLINRSLFRYQELQSLPTFRKICGQPTMNSRLKS